MRAWADMGIRVAMLGLLKRFITFNIRVCSRIQAVLPNTYPQLHEVYEDIIGRLLGFGDDAFVLDVGSGKTCPFASVVSGRSRIISLDVSRGELAHNADTRLKVVADASRGLPFADGQVDLVTSRFLMEHLRDTEAFIAETARVLKPGGRMLHIFPSKFGPVALPAQFLPTAFTKAISDWLYPSTRGVLGFPVFYDKCYPSAFTKLVEKHGFEIVDMRLGYNQSSYCFFFLPAYIVSACYDMLTYVLGIKNLCARILVEARKT